MSLFSEYLTRLRSSVVEVVHVNVAALAFCWLPNGGALAFRWCSRVWFGVPALFRPSGLVLRWSCVPWPCPSSERGPGGMLA